MIMKQANESTHSSIVVRGLCCATEENLIRKKLSSLQGIGSLSLNVVTHRLDVTHTCSRGEILSALDAIGLPGSVQTLPQASRFPRAQLIRTAASGALFLAGLVLHHLVGAPLIASPLFFASIGIAGWDVIKKAYRSALHFSLDMNLLMTVAVAGALGIGQFSEAAAVMVLFALSLFLESISVHRTRRALESLLSLSPPLATVKSEHGEGTVPAADVGVGSIVIVRPGERVPVDGTVVNGSSSLNQSALTGESLPVPKQPGDAVYAGSLNQRGILEIRATKPAADSTIARMIHLVEEAQSRKAPAQSFIESFARYYTPAVFIIALFMMIIPPLFFQASFEVWFYRALVALVIACPCALVISTPVTIVSALTRAARLGMLIKGGIHLESLARVQAVALDKTGTVTRGTTQVTDVIAVDSMSAADILRVVAAMEYRSEHHLADAFLRKAAVEHLNLDALKIDRFEALTGKGIRGVIDGRAFLVGSHPLIEEAGLCSPDIESILHDLEEKGRTTVILADDRSVLGIIGVADLVREESRNAVDALRRQGIRRVILLTGDNRGSAQSVSASVPMDEVRAELLPEEKLRAIEELRSSHGTTAMVGDGVNDAPAMAAADVGIAMGSVGSDTAMETADVVLMSDHLALVPAAIGLGKKALGIIRQNIALALGIKALILGLGVLGLASLWLAILADDGVTLLVILNSLRLLHWKPTGLQLPE